MRRDDRKPLVPFLPVLCAAALFGAPAVASEAPDGQRPAPARTDWHYPDEGSWAADFPRCDNRKQSPIAIRSPAVVPGARQPFAPHYERTTFSGHNNGHTFEFEPARRETAGAVDGGNYIEIHGDAYHLLQFHFHSPGEHRIPGTAGPTHGVLVAHFVHARDDGALAVVARLFELGGADPVIDRLWKPRLRREGKHFEVRVDPADLLPEDLSFYFYRGSLTTPPCSQGVRWHVLQNLGEVSREQMEYFTDVFPVSTRDLQSLNGRVIHGSR